MSDAARTLDPVPGIDLDDTRASLLDRFANPAIAHRDLADRHGRHPETAAAADRAGNVRSSAACRWKLTPSVAAWMRYALGIKENGETTRYAIRARTRSPRRSAARTMRPRSPALSSRPARRSVPPGVCPECRQMARGTVNKSAKDDARQRHAHRHRGRGHLKTLFALTVGSILSSASTACNSA